MTPGDSFYLYSIGTVSSAGLERCLDRAEVAGSNPARFTLRHKAPTGAFLFILLFPNKYMIHCGKLQKNTNEGTWPAGSCVIYLILIYFPFQAGGG